MFLGIFYRFFNVLLWFDPRRRHKNEILNGNHCSFKGSRDGKLIEINLTAEVVNKMFNVADMSAENFVQAFIDAYKIPDMTPDWNGSINWWEYTSPEGFKIKIYENKDIRIEKVAKAKERNFG